MSSFATIRRYYLIYEKVSRAKHPTFSDLKDYLHANGFEISARTLQRDMERLRRDYGIELVYDKNTNGYYINTAESIKPDVFLRFLDIVGTAEFLTESLKQSQDTLKYLHFEAQGNFKGTAFIPKVLNAVLNKQVIAFKHRTFQAKQDKAWVLEPYLLKEYQNRWYVIGFSEEYNAFRSFGLDRISVLNATGKTFVRKEPGPEENLDSTVGLTWSLSDIQEVVFSVIKPNDNYVKSLPIHPSQEIIEEDDEKTVFRIHVRLNFELTQKLIMHTYKLTVHKPESLAKDICLHIEKTLLNYK